MYRLPLPNPGARIIWSPHWLCVTKTHKNKNATHTRKNLKETGGWAGGVGGGWAGRWRLQGNLLRINDSIAEYKTGVASFFCRGPGSNYFQLRGPFSLCHKLSCSVHVTGPKQPRTVHTLTNGHDCVSMKLFTKTALNRMLATLSERSMGKISSFWGEDEIIFFFFLKSGSCKTLAQNSHRVIGAAFYWSKEGTKLV